MTRTHSLIAGACLLLLTVTVMAYLPGLGGGFIFDDQSALVENTRLHIEEIDTENLYRAAFSFDPGGRIGKRPLAMASLAVDHARGGLQPRHFKQTNLALHALNALLVFALMYRLFSLPELRAKKWALPGALAVSLVWAVHPLQVSTVLYVVQRMEMLAVTFIVLALIAYLLGRQRQIEGRTAWPWLFSCVPLTILGLGGKETALLLPAFALALELTVLRFEARSPAVARNWKWFYALSVIAALLLFVLVIAPKYWQQTIPFRDFGTSERLLTQFRVLWLYVAQIILPTPGSMPFFYDNFIISRDWLNPATTLFSAIGLLALLTGAFAMRHRWPLAALGILWFFAAHLMTSNVIALELVFEHRNYFALLGVLITLASLIAALPMRDGPRLKQVAVVLVVALVGVLGTLRAATWGDPLLWATEATNLNPNSTRASIELATVYLEMTDGYPGSPFNDFAIRELARSAEIPGASVISDQGLILISASAGRPVDPSWGPRLIEKLETQAITPEVTHAVFALLENRLKGVPIDDDLVLDAFVTMFNRVSLPAYSYAQVADFALTKANDPRLAHQLFRYAVDRSTDNPGYVQQMVDTLAKDGHHTHASAVADYAKSIGIPVDITVIESAPDESSASTSTPLLP
ncbi:MAG: hypothetical protein WCZ02_01375 [Lysobacterales bacterium]